MTTPNLYDPKEQTDSDEQDSSDSGEVIIIVTEPEIDEVTLEPTEH